MPGMFAHVNFYVDFRANRLIFSDRWKEGIDMSYEIFEKSVRRDTEPRVTISTLGRLQFNASASKILSKHAEG
jgi:hypothetical protein